MTDGTARDELIAMAAAGDLSPEDRDRLDELRRADPGVDAEIAALQRVVAGLGGLPAWIEEAPSETLRARVVRIGGGRASERPRRRWAIGLAAACLVVGVVSGAALAGLLSAPHGGAPGELGAVEHVDFATTTGGVSVDGDVVAHTWGTETVLTATGLEDGRTYSVVLVGENGRVAGSGTFRGVPGSVRCVMNGALLREDVAAVEVRAGDAVVAQADLPDVAP